MNHQQEFRSTLLGVIAIILWGTMIAVYKELTLKMGLFTAVAGCFMLGGGIGLLYIIIVQRAFRRLFQIPLYRLLVLTLCVVLNIIGLNIALGLAGQRQEVLTVGLINYLWPAFTLLLSVPIQRKRARIWLLPGTVIALSGVFIATFPVGNLSLSGMMMQWRDAWIPFLCVFFAALAWGLYSNYTRLWAADSEISKMPLYLFIAGVVALIIRFFFPERTEWSPSVVWSLLYAAIGPTLLAFAFWDVAMRKGRVVFVVSLSYLTPLLSTAVLCLYMQYIPSGAMWLACGMVIVGAIICNASVLDRVKTTGSG